ncbi:MAG: MBL fold metallo-hydrolase [Halorhodospira sp.]
MLDIVHTTWTPAATWEHLLAGDPLFILDVRNRDEFERWRVEGPRPTPTINRPYFELLDLDEEEDVTAAVRSGIREHLAHELPADRPILTVCGEGHTSEHLAAGLRELGYTALNLDGGMEAWGDFYAPQVIADTESYTLIQVVRPARGDISHVLLSDGEAAIIDPNRHLDTYEAIARDHGAKITAVLDTHAHADHISGGPQLAHRHGVPYRLHPYDGIHPLDMLPARIDYTPLMDGQAIPVGQTWLHALHVPGHTLGMVAFLVDGRYLISGDSIFLESIARPDLGGAAEAWTPLFQASLQRMLTLSEQTMVLPGHATDPSLADEQGRFNASLGQLCRTNPGLQQASATAEAFRSYILNSLPHFPQAYVEIKRINLGLSHPEEAEARRLEVGKNACALSEGKAPA